MKIRIIKKRDISKISKVWFLNFNENFFSILGLSYIKLYLNYYINNNKNLGFLCEKKKNILGFVLYGDDKEINYKILIKNYFKIILIFFKYLFNFDYVKLIKFLDVSIFFVLSSFFKLNFFFDQELLIIVVDKKHRSKKIGSKLLTYSNNQFKRKKVKLILVKTLIKYNKSILFYKKNKFIPKKVFFNRLHLIKRIS